MKTEQIIEEREDSVKMKMRFKILLSEWIKSRAKVLITISIDTDNNSMVVYSSKVVSLSGRARS